MLKGGHNLIHPAGMTNSPFCILSPFRLFASCSLYFVCFLFRRRQHDSRFLPIANPLHQSDYPFGPSPILKFSSQKSTHDLCVWTPKKPVKKSSKRGRCPPQWKTGTATWGNRERSCREAFEWRCVFSDKRTDDWSNHPAEDGSTFLKKSRHVVSSIHRRIISLLHTDIRCWKHGRRNKRSISFFAFFCPRSFIA